MASGPTLFADLSHDQLVWMPKRGLGYYPVRADASTYDQAYFDRYASNAETYLGRAIMKSRVGLVSEFYKGALIDIGIGSGAFIDRRNASGRPTYGFDVNPAAIEWLNRQHLGVNPYEENPEAISLWDVLEHIKDFRPLLASVQRWVFLSLPIFSDLAHVLRSKHFRPTEHYWYFTADGLQRLMYECGFVLVHYDDRETQLGREDIGSFVFMRFRG